MQQRSWYNIVIYAINYDFSRFHRSELVWFSGYTFSVMFKIIDYSSWHLIPVVLSEGFRIDSTKVRFGRAMWQCIFIFSKPINGYFTVSFDSGKVLRYSDDSV
jgi:hypothetical protein